MKKCNKCGAQVEDQSNFCTSCGSSDFSAIATNSEQPIQQLSDQVQNYPPIYTPAYQVQNVEADNETDKGNGNILAGIVGAFLFSMIGGLLYFVIYQIGVIAGICGLAIFVLANFGYNLFAKGNKNTIISLIVSIVMMILMIFLAEYVSLSFEIFQTFKDEGITIFDAIRATPEFLAEPEIGEAVAGDLAFAYIFGFIASISNIVNIVKARKKK